MRFINRTAPVWRILSGLLALTLALTNLGGASAVVPPFLNHPVGVVNASFGMVPNCILNNWTVVGSVTAVPSDWEDCKAVISAKRPSGTKATSATSSIEQTFTVNASTTSFQLTTRFTSTNPNERFAAQILTVYDASNNVIISLAFNKNDPNDTRLIFDLAAYAGQQVRLKLETRVNTITPDSPSFAAMEVYFGLMYSGPAPEPDPSGGN